MEPLPYQNFLKWLVILLSSIMILGFLFLVILIGYTFYNLEKSPETETRITIPNIEVPFKGEIKSVDLNGSDLIVVVQTEQRVLKIYKVSLSTGMVKEEVNLYQKK